MKFFTTPPNDIAYPFVLINCNNPKTGLNYLKKNGAETCIVDSGIEIFRDPQVKDYPEGHVDKIIKVYHEAKKYAKNVVATCPDYCDDYTPKSLWINDQITNIERTEANIIKVTKEHPEINWLIPIQGHWENIYSISRHIKLLDQDGILDQHQYFAVANLCTSKNVEFIRRTLKFVKMMLPHKKLHAFGIDIRATKITDFAGVLESFDSTGWTFPRIPGNASACTKVERQQYFLDYLSKYKLVEKANAE